MKRTLAFLLLAAMTGLGRGQDFTHIAPKPVPRTPPPGPALPPAAPPAATADPGQQLLSTLRGLIFVGSPQAVQPGELNTKGLVLRQVVVPAEPDFRRLVAPYLDQRLTRGQLNALINSIILFYRQHDHPLVNVIVPPQDVTGGTVQLVLLEGKLGRVLVSGNRWVASHAISDGINARPGQPVLATELQSDLDWINSNPFHSSDLVFQPGRDQGQTDLVLQTRDRFPARFYVGYEDSGNQQTGFDRYEAGVNWGDAFYLGLNQQLNYQYTTSGDGTSLRGHSGSYVVPLPWKNTLTFFGSYVDTRGVVPPLIGLNGRSYQISGRYAIPLPDFTVGKIKYTHDVNFGFDHKYNQNSLEFGSIPVSGTLYAINQFVVTYDGTESDPYGQTTLVNTGYFSPGDWGQDNNDRAFNAVHVGATSDYAYDQIGLQRTTRLPADWSLLLRGTVQWSTGNLTPSEQLSFGGYDTVRGYDDHEINTDEGYVFSTEVRTPSVALGELVHLPQLQDQLQFLGFWDYGVASNHTLLPGEQSETLLSSVGVGARYNISTYVTARFDYGFQLLRTGFDQQHGSRSDVGITVSY